MIHVFFIVISFSFPESLIFVVIVVFLSQILRHEYIIVSIVSTLAAFACYLFEVDKLTSNMTVC